MGKGFNNYMCKKFFHPASRDNLKRVWMAEQQTESYKKKQEELRVQYEKEQDLYTNKAMMSKESKEKLSVNFLYEPPPGTKKDREREDDEPEFKFEWQRKYNAPRESYCKGDQEIRDQPFGIQVRNVRCIKCHKWGHINTDKECPMYNQSGAGTEASSNLNPSELIRQMREDGLAMKKGAVGLLELPNGPSNVVNQQLIPSSSEDEDHMNETELKFLAGLSTKKKLKLLRKLEKMEKKKKKKKLQKKKEQKHKDAENSDSSDSDSPREKKRKDCDKGDSQIRKKSKHDGSNELFEKKGTMNELHSVLGRTMDFEGPPAKGSSNGHSKEKIHSRSRSNSRDRSRSRSPTKSHKKYEDRHYKNSYRTAQDSSKGRSRDIQSSHDPQGSKRSKVKADQTRDYSSSPSGKKSRDNDRERRNGYKGNDGEKRRRERGRSRSRSRENVRR